MGLRLAANNIGCRKQTELAPGTQVLQPEPSADSALSRAAPPADFAIPDHRA